MVGETQPIDTFRRPPRSLAEIAPAQHDVFTLADIEATGIGRAGARARTAAERLFRVHRGVYSLAPPELLTRRGRYLAAVLACGPRAVLSHRSAADLLELRSTDRASIDVTVPGPARANHAGVLTHRSRTLSSGDVTTVDCIPVTTVARTLLDLAEVVPPRAVERALDHAESSGRLDLTALHDQLARNRGRHRAHVLEQLLQQHHLGSTITASDLEEAFLALTRRSGVPDPECNALIVLPDGGEPIHGDFVWREHRLIVETDGRRDHFTNLSFEGDRERDQRCLLAGWRVVRITWRQVTSEPGRIADLLKQLLAKG